MPRSSIELLHAALDPAVRSVVESAGMHRIGLGLLAIIALGCAHENPLAPGLEGAPGVRRFLVCAPNTVIALPAEIQDVTGVLREQVDAYLKFQGREAQWLDLYQSKRIWGEALAAAKGKGTIEKTPEFFARALDEHYDFDAILMPSILLVSTRAIDGSASWDGVSRRMQLVNAPPLPVGRGQDTLAEGIRYGGVTGDVPVTSVQVLIFSPAGERVFEGRGGFAFVHDADLANSKNWQWQPRLRDLTADIDALREGIAIAFDPYLTPPDE